jgi:hypothetical protein
VLDNLTPVVQREEEDVDLVENPWEYLDDLIASRVEDLR